MIMMTLDQSHVSMSIAPSSRSQGPSYPPHVRLGGSRCSVPSPQRQKQWSETSWFVPTKKLASGSNGSRRNCSPQGQVWDIAHAIGNETSNTKNAVRGTARW